MAFVVPDAADAVGDHHRGDGRGTRGLGADADPPGPYLRRARALRHGGAGSRADGTDRRLLAGGGAGGVARLAVRAGVGIAGGEIEDDRSGDDRYAGRSQVEADLVLLEVAHDPSRRLEPVGASAREQDRVSLLDEGGGTERVGAQRRGGSATDVDAADRAVGRDDHRAAGEADGVGPVTDRDAAGQLHGRAR